MVNLISILYMKIIYATFILFFCHVSNFAQTGNGSADMKLKQAEKALKKLTICIEEFTTYDPNSTDFVIHKKVVKDNDGSLKHTNYQLICEDFEKQIEGIKKILPTYDYSSLMSQYTNLQNKYTSAKKGSANLSELHDKYKEKAAYEKSDEFALKKAQFQDKADDIIANDFHKKNIGKIVFSVSTITKENPAASLSNDFISTDKIYARAFFPRGFHNINMYDSRGDSARYLENRTIQPYVLVYVDGVLQTDKLESKDIEGKYGKNNTWQLWLHPASSDGLTDVRWVKMVDAMNIGQHKIKLEYYIIYDGQIEVNRVTQTNKYRALLASGEFILNKKSNELVKIGKKWSDIQTGMKNTVLEAQTLAIAKKNTNIDNMVSSAIKILDKDWRIVKNPVSGAVEYRYMRVQLKASNSKGYCYTNPMEIKQYSSGQGGFSSDLKLVGLASPDFGFDGYIDCE